MENIEYIEWVPAGALVKCLFAMVTLIVAVLTFAVFIFSEGLLVEDTLGVSFAWVILAILLLVFWNYRGLQIKISAQSLSVEYGRFDKKSFCSTKLSPAKKPKRLADTWESVLGLDLTVQWHIRLRLPAPSRSLPRRAKCLSFPPASLTEFAKS
jgi:hypothetical protein